MVAVVGAGIGQELKIFLAGDEWTVEITSILGAPK
jgi:hypothetical protein